MMAENQDIWCSFCVLIKLVVFWVCVVGGGGGGNGGGKTYHKGLDPELQSEQEGGGKTTHTAKPGKINKCIS